MPSIKRQTAKRKHRKVRTSWVGCHCPEGSKFVPLRGDSHGRVTRKWSCTKNTPQGVRFVRAVCPGEDETSPHRQPDVEHKRPRQAMTTEEGGGVARRQKKQKTSSCPCPEGATAISTKLGKRCTKNGRFIKAQCDEKTKAVV